MVVSDLVKPVDILLVEDNPGDVRLTKEALKEAKVINHLSVLKDREALAFLRREGRYADAPRPHLILLDLNLPKKDGREVLAEIKDDEKLKRIPVVLLTTSQNEQDVLKVYNLHANCYVTKPVDLDQFITVVKSIEDFWLRIVMLPKNGTHVKREARRAGLARKASRACLANLARRAIRLTVNGSRRPVPCAFSSSKTVPHLSGC